MSRTVARKKTEYRSALRSRKLIKQAYVELIKEKDMDKISVIDVVTRADINRGTFYAHYKSVIDVADQISDEILSALLEFLNEFDNTRLIENPLPFLTNIARFLEKDLEYYRVLINSQRSIAFFIQLKTLLIEKILSDEKKMSAIKNKDQFMISVDLFASGFVGVYQDWFNNKIKISLNDLTLHSSEIIKNGFKHFLPAKK
ncbi:MAG: TetR/AcrR family transcriptional regulator C-terminal domain-containing protein [Syntrophaceae bacterium]|nr:TetR/AcrR family transcriptional regulator C-terminal domain-containing protein [Syntrophaceae bacterium]